MADYKRFIAKLLIFEEPKKVEKFILNESVNERVNKSKPDKSDNPAQSQNEAENASPSKHNIGDMLFKTPSPPAIGKTFNAKSLENKNSKKQDDKQDDKNGKKQDNKQGGKQDDKQGGKQDDKQGGKQDVKQDDRQDEKQDEKQDVKKDNKQDVKKDNKQDEKKKSEISKSLPYNIEYMKKIYNIPTNGDIVLREFKVVVGDKPLDAFIIFYDGMVERKAINDDILQSMMLLSNLDIKGDDADISEYIKDFLLPYNQLKMLTKYRKVIDEINFGSCGIFIDGVDAAFTADVKGWEHRMVGRPNTELVIRGPQEGFNEILRVNTALIRKILKDEDLIAEDISIGRRSKTPCSLLYIKDIANDDLVNEVRKRLKSIKIDYLIDSGELEQLIEDSSLSSAPQVLATERPDRVAAMLADGKVAIVVHNSPFVLVVPVTFTSLLHSSEDSYVRFPYVNLLRAMRFVAITLSLLLPGIYIAITNYHQEMIPTDLLLAIEASREKVPFPSLVELLIMEIAFELIREAGIRIPGPIGPTLGIIGALILGQAAVAANIVSPILIIIVAVTGIGSFAIPNFSLALSFRILRFFYIIFGAAAGFFGITAGLFIHGLGFGASKSFGVPFLSPLAPRTSSPMTDELTRAPIWKQEKRPDFLNTKDKNKQPHISRRWVEGKKGGNKDGQ